MNETIAYIRQALENLFQPEEIRSLTRLIFREVCGLEPHQIILYKDKDLSDATRDRIKRIADRLAQHEPIQYILGTTTFYGYTFRVTPAVLIPRPETEELVDLIVHEEQTEGLRLLDIGTGSGCIAISLAKQLEKAIVYALDISAEALKVAAHNAETNGARVRFIQQDILHDEDWPEEAPDIIVSNPPYVMNRESKEMEERVLAHEPHSALFVPDENPLLFYRAIAHFGLCHLKTSGRLYFEINAALGNETRDLMVHLGYRDSRIIKDMAGKDRIIKAIR